MTVSQTADALTTDHPLRVPLGQVRWNCDASQFDFETTADVPKQLQFLAQDDAIEALRYGLEVHAPGQHVFVRGLSGTGRLTLVEQLMAEVQPACPVAQDRLYVHDFERPDRPRLVSLPRGRGRDFRDRIDQLARFISESLLPALSSDAIRARRREMDETLQERLQERSQSFDAELAQAGLAVVKFQNGDQMQTAIVPRVDGQPTAPEAYQALVEEGKIDADEAKRVQAAIASFSQAFQQVGEDLQKLQLDHAKGTRTLYEAEARSLLDAHVHAIESEFPADTVKTFLNGIVDDVVGGRLRALGEGNDTNPATYKVNLIAGHQGEGCPVIVENTPTMQNLLGTIDRVVLPNGAVQMDHTMIRAGSLLRAEGGFLVLDASDVLSEPGAWKLLVRTLRTGRLEIVPHDSSLYGAPVKPEPIDINVKVVLLGDPGLYYQLDAVDRDFQQLFKVLADFQDEIPVDPDALGRYAGWVANLAESERLPAFTAGAVAALCTHGARIAGRHDRLTLRLGRLADLAREAAHITMRHDTAQPHVTESHVEQAITRSRRRADLPSRRFRARIAEGTLRIDTRGSVVGQVNGLAVLKAGPLTFGFPARITATVGVGTRGLVNIEREASLSGSIHNKGFAILRGLLQHKMQLEHPLAMHAAVAFEQSYGGVDGDSASGAEACCLLSALTGVPLRQNLAMTGAIDQFGSIQPIGGASEKIEGFYDTCVDAGLTGDQGVIIPKSNIANLQLRPDVAAAYAEGRFHLFAVSTIEEALELFTGVPAGVRGEDGQFPPDSILGLAVERSHELWRRATGRLMPGFDHAQVSSEDDEIGFSNGG
tara:strand:- start:11229 stop:13700 length:2472 start_codon:yes stop_codon:yes gene_type:complete